jgi:hypothetical protein
MPYVGRRPEMQIRNSAIRLSKLPALEDYLQGLKTI